MASARQRYDKLKLRRQPFLERAWDYAELTIPSLLPRHGHHSSMRMIEPYQAFASRLVVNLSSQLLLALLPPGAGSFTLTIPPEMLVKAGKLNAESEVEQKLALAAALITAEMESKAWRQPTHLSLQLMVVSGNALEQILPDNRIRTFRLDQYVVVRDYVGHLLEIIIEEKISPLALPPEIVSELSKDKQEADADVCLYTWVKRTPKGDYAVHQQVEEIEIPGSKGTYDADRLPFTALRWSIIPGEDYGRGKVEEHIGDIRAFEALSKSMVDGAAMAARHITIVEPNATGTNLSRKIAKANNGDVITGHFEDINMLQFQNVTGLQLVQQELQRIAEQLGAAFLLRAGVVRDSERTTAAEVRMVAEELEGTLGGVYSMLSEDMMRVRLERLMNQMVTQQKLPAFPKGSVVPRITVGLEALGREKDVQRVMSAAQIAQLLDPQQEYADTAGLLRKAFTGLGLPALVRSNEEAQGIREQRAQAQAAAQAGGKIAQMAAQTQEG